jgi:hypothetical protein
MSLVFNHKGPTAHLTYDDTRIENHDVSKKTQVFRVTVLEVSKYRFAVFFKVLDCLTLNMKDILFFKTSGNSITS